MQGGCERGGSFYPFTKKLLDGYIYEVYTYKKYLEEPIEHDKYTRRQHNGHYHTRDLLSGVWFSMRDEAVL